MLNLNQLRVFYHAAKHLNFTVAAGKLFITQPAVTAQIKSFEEHCNLKLFQRRGRKLYLTSEGQILYEYATKIFRYEQEVEHVLEDMLKLERGELRLGTTKAYARYFMPVLLSRFHRSYPNIRLNLDEGSSRDMILSLVSLKNEVAVIARAIDHPEVAFTPFSKEELAVIAAPDHRLARKKSVSLAELAREPLIMKDRGSGTRKLVDEMFARENFRPNVLMETSNAEFIKQLVQRGEGVSFLVKEAVAAELKEKKLALVRLSGAAIFLDVSIAHLKDATLSPPALAFVEILSNLRAEYMQPQGIGLLMSRLLSQRREK